MEKRILIFNIIYYAVILVLTVLSINEDVNEVIAYNFYLIVFLIIALFALVILKSSGFIEPKSVVDKIGILTATPILPIFISQVYSLFNSGSDLQTAFIELDFLFASFFIDGMFITILVILVARRRDKTINRILAIDFARWILIAYAGIGLLYFISGFLFPHEGLSTFLVRASGSYKYFYWFMLLAEFSPLLLLIKKIGTIPYMVLIASALINCGRWFESFVIHVTSLHRDYAPNGSVSFLPFEYEVTALLSGFIVGFVLLWIAQLWTPKKDPATMTSE